MAEASNKRDSDKGFFGGRSVVFWTITGGIATVLSLLVGILSFIATSGFSSSGHHPTPTPNQQLNAAAQIRACETTHRLNRATDQQHPAADTTVFASCAWPPPPAADPDGYTVISSQQANGPGQSEASNTDFVDRITGPCARFELTYTFGSQGTLEHLPSSQVSPDTVTTVANPGASWTGGLPFYPPRGEVDVLRSGRYALDQASCVR